MSDPSIDATRDEGSSGSRLRRFLFTGRRRRWVIGIVLINLVGVLALAGIGSAKVADCGGGFSGYSGGGNECVADIQVNQYGAPSPVHIGQKLIYLVTIRNHGPDRTFYVQLDVRLPKGVQVNWYMASSQYGYCEYENLVVSCFFYEGPAKGQAVAATIVVVPLVKGEIRSVATARGSFKDPNLANNTSVMRVTVLR